jgi:hypothetical protein
MGAVLAKLQNAESEFLPSTMVLGDDVSRFPIRFVP